MRYNTSSSQITWYSLNAIPDSQDIKAQKIESVDFNLITDQQIAERSIKLSDFIGSHVSEAIEAIKGTTEK